MKILLISFLCSVALWQVRASDEQFIPAPLNDVMPKIHARMSIEEVEAILSAAYPHVSHRSGPWSGQTGYIEYDLDKRFTLGVAFVLSGHREIVDGNLLFSVTDATTKHRWDIKRYDCARPAKQNSRFLGQ